MVPEKVMRLLGIWPLNSDDILRSSLGRWCFAMLTQVSWSRFLGSEIFQRLFSQVSAICSLTTAVYRHCLDIDDTMDAFLMDLSAMVSLSKVFILRFNWKHTYALVNSIVEDWSNVKDLGHRNIMAKYEEKGQLVSMLLLYMGYASGLSFAVKTLPFHLLPFQVRSFCPSSILQIFVQLFSRSGVPTSVELDEHRGPDPEEQVLPVDVLRVRTPALVP